jgi:xanthine dehydrogenase accessory factor
VDRPRSDSTPDASEPFVEATVVRARSPTSVKAGDAAVVRPDGTIEGFVGGTCAEASLRLYSLRALEAGEPLLLRILPGAVEDRPEAEEGAVTVTNPCQSGGAMEIFLNPRLPAPTIRVVGESPIGLALADLATRLGYAVELSAAEDSRPRPDDAAVVVASHGHDEERVLTAALRKGVPYVGLVASVARGRAVMESLDLPDELRARIRTPAGLEIGADTPEEIALAILAEIVALRRSHEADVPAKVVAASSASVGVEPKAAEPDRNETRTSPARRVAISNEAAVDPVCGMEVAVSAASIQLERDGERYYFCSEDCRDSFSAEGVSGAAVR